MHLIERFSPKNLQVSGKMTAILGCLLNHPGWSNPQLHELIVTSDSCLLGRHEGDCGANEFLGSVEDFADNLIGVVHAVGLDGVEALSLVEVMKPNITSFDPDFDLEVILGLAG